jgi:hypothetical protein
MHTSVPAVTMIAASVTQLQAKLTTDITTPFSACTQFQFIFKELSTNTQVLTKRMNLSSTLTTGGIVYGNMLYTNMQLMTGEVFGATDTISNFATKLKVGTQVGITCKLQGQTRNYLWFHPSGVNDGSASPVAVDTLIPTTAAAMVVTRTPSNKFTVTPVDVAADCAPVGTAAVHCGDDTSGKI